MTISVFFRILILSASAMIIVACSSRSTPAPIIELYQGKNFRDFDKNAFAGKKYQVKKGDTLFSIAWYSGSDYQDLARINNIPRPYNIFPGQLLWLKEQTKSIINKSKNKTGQISKIKANQIVDPHKKQAYGETSDFVNRTLQKKQEAHFASKVSHWTWPASGKIVKGFSLSEQGNKGIDIAGKLGTPILAAADGKVVYTGDALRGYGKLVIIKHTDAFLTAYAHNDEILVKEQQWVKAGQRLASMGSSGTNQIMLHFEVRYKGKSVDPLRYISK
jgi:lipoprotein NlpD